MNAQNIFDGVTDIRDDLIDGAKETSQQQKRQDGGQSGRHQDGGQSGRRQGRKQGGSRGKKRWLAGAVAAVLAIAVLAGVLLRPDSRMTAYAIAQAEYPKMAPYPSGLAQFDNKVHDAWWEDVKAQRRDLGDTSSLQAFFARSAQTFLAGADGQNRVYSPLNVYMALAMLAQLTGGESRGQILALLGGGSMDALRQQASDVWNSNYRDDGALISILAASLWLNEYVEFNQDTMDILAKDFYASSYQGEMGSEQLNKALQDWLNEQTGSLLKEQAGNIKLNSETVLALAATVSFKAKWHMEFAKKNTAPQTFHTPAGDVETDFMYQRYDQTYFWGEKFAAISQPFEGGGSMWFLLPDEGTTPEELLSDGEAMDFLFAVDQYKWENQKFLFVNKSIPKFDVSSQFELGEGLQALGITDVFDPEVSDFTPMTTDVDEPVFLSQASHAARVVIDEEGCTAVAYTVMAAAGAAEPPDDEVDFVLDRPFLFCITGISELPLFVGIVNYPTGM